MKIVIQCSATKNTRAGAMTHNGRRIKFVAHPDLCNTQTSDQIYFHPDDLIPMTTTSWRDRLAAYNQSGNNPEGLLSAVDLYKHPIYGKLLRYAGINNLFILSAGWGLIRADFLIPDYDITFSRQAASYKRRNNEDHFADFNQLSQSDLQNGDLVYFFGGLDYLPLYYDLTGTLIAKKVIFHASGYIPERRGYEYRQYDRSFTNWHYQCAEDFISDCIFHRNRTLIPA